MYGEYMEVGSLILWVLLQKIKKKIIKIQSNTLLQLRSQKEKILANSEREKS